MIDLEFIHWTAFLRNAHHGNQSALIFEKLIPRVLIVLIGIETPLSFATDSYGDTKQTVQCRVFHP